MQKNIIAIIGGGAAGMMAAIRAANESTNNYVIILERNDRIGKKILSTGNGKCNFSNLIMEEQCYRGSDVKKAFSLINQFGPEETILFFKELGMLIKNKNGYLYPATEQAATVLDVLRFQLRELQVQIKTESKVVFILKDKCNKFLIKTENETIKADKVILTTGGKAAPKTGSDGLGFQIAKNFGHTIIDCVPALVQLKCSENYMKAISGVRCDARISLYIDQKKVFSDRGEVQFTDYGLSGIVIFQASRFAAIACKGKKHVQVKLDFLPDYSKEELKLFIAQRKLLFSGRNVEEFFTGILHKKLTTQILKLCELKLNHSIEEIKEDKINSYFHYCKEWNFNICGTNSFEQAQVCAGGVDMEEVDETLESKLVKGLFFAGEILDVDGICGGYNLQWAWTSGNIAGESAGKIE